MCIYYDAWMKHIIVKEKEEKLQELVEGKKKSLFGDKVLPNYFWKIIK